MGNNAKCRYEEQLRDTRRLDNDVYIRRAPGHKGAIVCSWQTDPWPPFSWMVGLQV